LIGLLDDGAVDRVQNVWRSVRQPTSVSFAGASFPEP
jgi:hypothetical protein